MGEWLALRPTVSLRCRSTEIAKYFGPGTSRRCRARVFYRRGRGCFAGVVAGCATGVPAGCATGVPAGCATGVPAGCATGVPSAVGPARRPRRELRSARRLEARPGRCPAGALLTGGAWCALHVTRPGPLRPQPLRCLIAAPAINVACNSPATISNHEIAALELQRFEALLNLRPIELHARFVGSGPVVCRETITCEYLHSAQSVCTAAP